DSEHEVLPWQFSAAKLGTKLWGGYARYAIPELERLRLSEDASLTERRAAAWQLTRWFYVEGEYERVLKYIEFVKQLGGKEHPTSRWLKPRHLLLCSGTGKRTWYCNAASASTGHWIFSFCDPGLPATWSSSAAVLSPGPTRSSSTC